MNNYIVFFGKSQDFRTCFYDSNGFISDFNAIIKDFDKLESRIFTVDSNTNKEILTRKFFTFNEKPYSLLSLYSFAQALNGERIAGSTYGVALLSDYNVKITDKNLALLRVAKNKFAELSLLKGTKFNKSDFKEDTDKIWKAIINNKDGNLLEAIDLSTLVQTENKQSYAVFVRNLFSDSSKLNNSISEWGNVYFSEDIEHLKRTQKTWGPDTFPIFWELGNQLMLFKEPEPKTQEINKNNGKPFSNEKTINDDVSFLKMELSDCKYEINILKGKLDKLEKAKKINFIIIISLFSFILLIILYFNIFSVKESGNKATVVPTIIVPTEKDSLPPK
jgi:hypothetical protein